MASGTELANWLFYFDTRSPRYVSGPTSPEGCDSDLADAMLANLPRHMSCGSCLSAASWLPNALARIRRDVELGLLAWWPEAPPSCEVIVQSVMQNLQKEV